MTHSKKPINVFVLTMINLATILSIRNWPLTAQYGYASIFFIMAAALFLLIPTSLVAAELSTGWPEKGGIYVWVKEALGEKLGFLAVFLLWIENVVWYPMILTFVSGTLAFVFNPEYVNHAFYNYLVVLIVFWLSTWANSKGMELSGKLSSIGVIIGTIFPGLIIIAIGFYWLFSGQPLQITMNWSQFIPKFENLSDYTFLAGIMLGFSGMEMPSVHANDVLHPRKDFPRAILISSSLIIGLTILGSFTIAMITPAKEISLTAGGISVVYSVFKQMGFENLVPIVALMITIGALASVSTWIAGPCRGLLAAAQEGDLPEIFRKNNRHQMPVNMMIAQGFIVTLLATILLLAPSVTSSFWMLVALASQAYLMMYALMFVAALVLRYKKPDVKRAYQIPFGKFGIWVVCSLGLMGSAFGFFIGFIPPSQLETLNLIGYEAFLILGIVSFILIPFFIFQWQKKQKNVKTR